MWVHRIPSWRGFVSQGLENICSAQCSSDVILFVFKTNWLPGLSQGWPESPAPCGGVILRRFVFLSSHAFPGAGGTRSCCRFLIQMQSLPSSLFLLLIGEMSWFFMSGRLANPDAFHLCGSLIYLLLRMLKRRKETLFLRGSDFDCGPAGEWWYPLADWGWIPRLIPPWLLGLVWNLCSTDDYTL